MGSSNFLTSENEKAKTMYDVIQIGYGPVSQVLALTLARQGWKVAVFEKWTKRYPLPRAVCVDHEMFRMLGTLGLRDKLPLISHPAPPYRWFNAEWKELLFIDWSEESISGGTDVNFVHQPTLEEMLDQTVNEEENVDLNLGWEAISVSQTSEYAEVVVRNLATGEERAERAKFIIGADGANSLVRKSIGAGLEDLGFNADWLVIDILPNEDAELDIPPAAQWCNPERPTTIVPAGIRDGRYYRRWEFMRLPNETVEALETDEMAWQLLEPWVKPHQAQMVRNKVYSFKSLIAKGWWQDRLLIAGDAGHVMPPFMGQGMCAGFCDNWNLAWKLDLILRGKADAKLLATYEPERRPHVRDIIEMSMFLGKIICIPDPKVAAERDLAFFEGTAPAPAPFPHLIDGLLDRHDDGTVRAPAGQLGPHGHIKLDGAQGWFDEVAGTGFALITLDDDPAAHLDQYRKAVIESLDIKVVTFSDQPAPGRAADIDGKYRRFMTGHGLGVMLTRPDFYIFGGTARVEDAGALIDALAQSLTANGVHLPHQASVLQTEARAFAN
jgi:3-(3-hydroxy-phenyl)propionate hydroxylase/flavoprotein hydroxylase